MEFELKAKDLAFYDAFINGLVPVKVLEISKDGDEKVARCRITSTRGAYKGGEIVHLRCTQNLVRRDQVYTRRGQIMIRGTVNHVIG